MDDLISRQAAIDAIERAVTKEVARWSVKELPSAHCDNCPYPDEYVKEKEDALRWIPVTERLPEEEERGEYLTTNMYHNVFCDYWSGSHFDRTEVVIAWQPLPDPYKEEE